jgi:hypothetical protein
MATCNICALTLAKIVSHTYSATLNYTKSIRYTSGNTKLIDAGRVASHLFMIVYGSVHKTAAEAASTVACQFETVTVTPKTAHTPGVWNTTCFDLVSAARSAAWLHCQQQKGAAVVSSSF